MVTVTGNSRRQPDAGPGAADPARDGRPDPATGNRADRNHAARRRRRSIGFADPEWTLIEQAAARKGLTAPELIRLGAVALAEERLFEHPPVPPAGEPLSEPPPVALSPGHIALIEATWRAVDLLATLATRQMTYHEIDTLLGAARNAMIEAMNKGPDRMPPEEAPAASRQKPGGKARPLRRAASGLLFY